MEVEKIILEEGNGSDIPKRHDVQRSERSPQSPARHVLMIAQLGLTIAKQRGKDTC
jgi:hypothetical protein